MGFSGRMLTVMIVGVVLMLIYAGITFMVNDHVEDVLAQAPTVPDSAITAQRTAACERATEYYDRLLEEEPAGGNYELRENQLEIAEQGVNRACSTD